MRRRAKLRHTTSKVGQIETEIGCKNKPQEGGNPGLGRGRLRGISPFHFSDPPRIEFPVFWISGKPMIRSEIRNDIRGVWRIRRLSSGHFSANPVGHILIGAEPALLSGHIAGIFRQFSWNNYFPDLLARFPASLDSGGEYRKSPK